MPRTKATFRTEVSSKASSKQVKPLKADIIAAAIQAGVPANRLTGTIAEINAEVTSYVEAQVAAAADVADAALSSESAPLDAQATKNGIHPMNGVYIGGAIATLWHFLS